MSSDTGETSAERNVEIWKIKKLIKSLEAARGYVHNSCHCVHLYYGKYVTYLFYLSGDFFVHGNLEKCCCSYTLMIN